MKAKYLYHVLAILLNKKETHPLLSWKSICELAAQKVRDFKGANLIENNSDKGAYHWLGARTIMQWFRH